MAVARSVAAAINSSDHSTKGTPSDSHPPRNSARRHVLRLLVGVGFQSLFHPPLGVLFTFPSRYSFPIGGQGVLSLGGWSPLLPTGFPVSRGTQAAHLAPTSLRQVRGSHPLRRRFPPASLVKSCVSSKSAAPLRRRTMRAYNPAVPEDTLRFGLIPFRSPLLRESRLISSPHGTEMFQFPRFPPDGLSCSAAGVVS